MSRTFRKRVDRYVTLGHFACWNSEYGNKPHRFYADRNVSKGEGLKSSYCDVRGVILGYSDDIARSRKSKILTNKMRRSVDRKMIKEGHTSNAL